MLKEHHIMKKLLAILISATMLCSCSTIAKHIKYGDYEYVKDYRRQMELLEANFPEVYNLYRNGDVILDEMFEYTDRNGVPQVHISYHYRYGRR